MLFAGGQAYTIQGNMAVPANPELVNNGTQMLPGLPTHPAQTAVAAPMHHGIALAAPMIQTTPMSPPEIKNGHIPSGLPPGTDVSNADVSTNNTLP